MEWIIRILSSILGGLLGVLFISIIIGGKDDDNYKND